VEEEVVHPPDVICYDGEDPYLVVAADKGTAHLSDTANAVADEYDFWLADAFASGGSVGYDHKELGITAKGAWECVKRHFRELDLNIHEPFSVVGIGDMGGDVFGNGMILSENIKLRAAFNHLHIFLDPDPDPSPSFEERKRLFEQSGGWGEYDTSLISDGGGIFDRSAKKIDLPEESREMLELEDDEPGAEEVVSAILSMKADLLWNGGIGTYIKSSEEAHSEVGDPQNNACRVDADEVQVKVIGEGGNLGITQRGRIELDRNGVKLNTDALDNSGGVDLSDHEVNFKILLQESIKRGELESDQRESVLENQTEAMVDDVTHDNYEQSGVISLERIDSDQHLQDYRNL
ncbi:MAG: NAD-glutamate dehydrogenase domain-containing protein, partial [bacterium]